MDLISLLVAVIVIGLIFWLLQRLPIGEPFKTVALVLVVVLAIVYLLGFL